VRMQPENVPRWTIQFSGHENDTFCHIETSIRTFKIQNLHTRTYVKNEYRLCLVSFMQIYYSITFDFIHHWTIAMLSEFKCTFQHLGFMFTQSKTQSLFQSQNLVGLLLKETNWGCDPLIREELSWFSLYCDFIAQGTQPKEHTPHSPRQEKLIYRPTLQSWWSTLYNA